MQDTSSEVGIDLGLVTPEKPSGGPASRGWLSFLMLQLPHDYPYHLFTKLPKEVLQLLLRQLQSQDPTEMAKQLVASLGESGESENLDLSSLISILQSLDEDQLLNFLSSIGPWLLLLAKMFSFVKEQEAGKDQSAEDLGEFDFLNSYEGPDIFQMLGKIFSGQEVPDIPEDLIAKMIIRQVMASGGNAAVLNQRLQLLQASGNLQGPEIERLKQLLPKLTKLEIGADDFQNLLANPGNPDFNIAFIPKGSSSIIEFELTFDNQLVVYLYSASQLLTAEFEINTDATATRSEFYPLRVFKVDLNHEPDPDTALVKDGFKYREEVLVRELLSLTEKLTNEPVVSGLPANLIKVMAAKAESAAGADNTGDAGIRPVRSNDGLKDLAMNSGMPTEIIQTHLAQFGGSEQNLEQFYEGDPEQLALFATRGNRIMAGFTKTLELFEKRHLGKDFAVYKLQLRLQNFYDNYKAFNPGILSPQQAVLIASAADNLLRNIDKIYGKQVDASPAAAGDSGKAEADAKTEAVIPAELRIAVAHLQQIKRQVEEIRVKPNTVVLDQPDAASRLDLKSISFRDRVEVISAQARKPLGYAGSSTNLASLSLTMPPDLRGFTEELSYLVDHSPEIDSSSDKAQYLAYQMRVEDYFVNLQLEGEGGLWEKLDSIDMDHNLGLAWMKTFYGQIKQLNRLLFTYHKSYRSDNSFYDKFRGERLATVATMLLIAQRLTETYLNHYFGDDEATKAKLIKLLNAKCDHMYRFNRDLQKRMHDSQVQCLDKKVADRLVYAKEQLVAQRLLTRKSHRRSPRSITRGYKAFLLLLIKKTFTSDMREQLRLAAAKFIETKPKDNADVELILHYSTPAQRRLFGLMKAVGKEVAFDDDTIIAKLALHAKFITRYLIMAENYRAAVDLVPRVDLTQPDRFESKVPISTQIDRNVLDMRVFKIRFSFNKDYFPCARDHRTKHYQVAMDPILKRALDRGVRTENARQAYHAGDHLTPTEADALVLGHIGDDPASKIQRLIGFYHKNLVLLSQADHQHIFFANMFGSDGALSQAIAAEPQLLLDLLDFIAESLDEQIINHQIKARNIVFVRFFALLQQYLSEEQIDASIKEQFELKTEALTAKVLNLIVVKHPSMVDTTLYSSELAADVQAQAAGKAEAALDPDEPEAKADSEAKQKALADAAEEAAQRKQAQYLVLQYQALICAHRLQLPGAKDEDPELLRQYLAAYFSALIYMGQNDVPTYKSSEREWYQGARFDYRWRHKRGELVDPIADKSYRTSLLQISKLIITPPGFHVEQLALAFADAMEIHGYEVERSDLKAYAEANSVLLESGNTSIRLSLLDAKLVSTSGYRPVLMTNKVKEHEFIRRVFGADLPPQTKLLCSENSGDKTYKFKFAGVNYELFIPAYGYPPAHLVKTIEIGGRPHSFTLLAPDFAKSLGVLPKRLLGKTTLVWQEAQFTEYSSRWDFSSRRKLPEASFLVEPKAYNPDLKLHIKNNQGAVELQPAESASELTNYEPSDWSISAAPEFPPEYFRACQAVDPGCFFRFNRKTRQRQLVLPNMKLSFITQGADRLVCEAAPEYQLMLIAQGTQISGISRALMLVKNYGTADEQRKLLIPVFELEASKSLAKIGNLDLEVFGRFLNTADKVAAGDYRAISDIPADLKLLGGISELITLLDKLLPMLQSIAAESDKASAQAKAQADSSDDLDSNADSEKDAKPTNIMDQLLAEIPQELRPFVEMYIDLEKGQHVEDPDDRFAAYMKAEQPFIEYEIGAEDDVLALQSPLPILMRAYKLFLAGFYADAEDMLKLITEKYPLDGTPSELSILAAIAENPMNDSRAIRCRMMAGCLVAEFKQSMRKIAPELQLEMPRDAESFERRRDISYRYLNGDFTITLLNLYRRWTKVENNLAPLDSRANLAILQEIIHLIPGHRRDNAFFQRLTYLLELEQKQYLQKLELAAERLPGYADAERYCHTNGSLLPVEVREPTSKQIHRFVPFVYHLTKANLLGEKEDQRPIAESILEGLPVHLDGDLLNSIGHNMAMNRLGLENLRAELAPERTTEQFVSGIQQDKAQLANWFRALMTGALTEHERGVLQQKIHDALSCIFYHDGFAAVFAAKQAHEHRNPIKKAKAAIMKRLKDKFGFSGIFESEDMHVLRSSLAFLYCLAGYDPEQLVDSGISAEHGCISDYAYAVFNKEKPRNDFYDMVDPKNAIAMARAEAEERAYREDRFYHRDYHIKQVAKFFKSSFNKRAGYAVSYLKNGSKAVAREPHLTQLKQAPLLNNRNIQQFLQQILPGHSPIPSMLRGLFYKLLIKNRETFIEFIRDKSANVLRPLLIRMLDEVEDEVAAIPLFQQRNQNYLDKVRDIITGPVFERAFNDLKIIMRHREYARRNEQQQRRLEHLSQALPKVEPRLVVESEREPTNYVKQAINAECVDYYAQVESALQTATAEVAAKPDPQFFEAPEDAGAYLRKKVKEQNADYRQGQIQNAERRIQANAALTAFYDRAAVTKLAAGQDLIDTQHSVRQRILRQFEADSQDLSQELFEVAEDLTDEANKLLKTRVSAKQLAMPDLVRLCLRGELELYQEATGLDAATCRSLHSRIAEYVIRQGAELQFLERAIGLLRKIQKEQDQEAKLDMVARFGRLANQWIAYDQAPAKVEGVANQPEIPAEQLGWRNNTILTVMELMDNFMFYPQQISKLRALLRITDDGRWDDVAIQLIMGDGKTWAITPAWVLNRFTGENLVTVDVPKELLLTNYKDYYERLLGKYGVKVNVLQFDRQSISMNGAKVGNSVTALRQFYAKLCSMICNRELLLTHGEALQSLELKWVELNEMLQSHTRREIEREAEAARAKDKAKTKADDDDEDDDIEAAQEEAREEAERAQIYSALLELENILDIFRFHQDVISDESDKRFDRRLALVYAAGPEAELEQWIVDIYAKLYQYFIKLELDFEGEDFNDGQPLRMVDVLQHHAKIPSGTDWDIFISKILDHLIDDHKNSPLKVFLKRLGPVQKAHLREYLYIKVADRTNPKSRRKATTAELQELKEYIRIADNPEDDANLRLLDTCKNLLTNLLGTLTPKQLNNHYGPTKAHRNKPHSDQICCPYSGPSKPKVNSRYSSDETTVLNIQYALNSEPSFALVRDFLEHSFRLADQESQTKSQGRVYIAIGDTDVAKRLYDLLDITKEELNLVNYSCDDAAIYQAFYHSEIGQRLRRSPAFRIEVARMLVLPRISFYESSMKTNAYTYRESVRSMCGESGTVGNADEFPDTLRFDPSQSIGTDGRTLAYMEEKFFFPDPQAEAAAAPAEPDLDDLLEAAFASDEDSDAFLDAALEQLDAEPATAVAAVAPPAQDHTATATTAEDYSEYETPDLEVGDYRALQAHPVNTVKGWLHIMYAYYGMVDQDPGKIRCIIDNGLFKDYENIDAAREIARFLKHTGSPIKWVKFWHNDVFSAISVAHPEQAPRELGSSRTEVTAKLLEGAKPADCFTYYDRNHTVGADVFNKFDSHALMSFSILSCLREVLQAAMRMRQLADLQRVVFIIGGVLKASFPDRNWDFKEIVNFLFIKQYQRQADNNYIGALENMDAVIRDQLKQIVIREKRYEAKKRLFEIFRDMFIAPTETNPVRKYGAIDFWAETVKLLDQKAASKLRHFDELLAQAGVQLPAAAIKQLRDRICHIRDRAKDKVNEYSRDSAANSTQGFELEQALQRQTEEEQAQQFEEAPAEVKPRRRIIALSDLSLDFSAEALLAFAFEAGSKLPYERKARNFFRAKKLHHFNSVAQRILFSRHEPSAQFSFDPELLITPQAKGSGLAKNKRGLFDLMQKPFCRLWVYQPASDAQPDATLKLVLVSGKEAGQLKASIDQLRNQGAVPANAPSFLLQSEEGAQMSTYNLDPILAEQGKGKADAVAEAEDATAPVCALTEKPKFIAEVAIKYDRLMEQALFVAGKWDELSALVGAAEAEGREQECWHAKAEEGREPAKVAAAKARTAQKLWLACGVQNTSRHLETYLQRIAATYDPKGKWVRELTEELSLSCKKAKKASRRRGKHPVPLLDEPSLYAIAALTAASAIGTSLYYTKTLGILFNNILALNFAMHVQLTMIGLFSLAVTTALAVLGYQLRRSFVNKRNAKKAGAGFRGAQRPSTMVDGAAACFEPTVQPILFAGKVGEVVQSAKDHHPALSSNTEMRSLGI